MDNAQKDAFLRNLAAENLGNDAYWVGTSFDDLPALAQEHDLPYESVVIGFRRADENDTIQQNTFEEGN